MAWRAPLALCLIASCAGASPGNPGSGGTDSGVPGHAADAGDGAEGGGASGILEAGAGDEPSPEVDGGDASLPAPWVLLDLSGWALDLPVNAKGQESGTNDATVVNAINASFPAYGDKYFHSVPSGGVLLYAPVDGATTTNSDYPRCELAETAYSEAHGGSNWPLSLGGTLDVEMSVDSAPSIHDASAENGDIVIGQIKGTQTELCKIRYTGGDEVIGGTSFAIYVEYNNATVSGSFGIVPSTSRIPLNAKLSYEIKLANNAYTVTISYGGATFSGSSGALDASWNSDTYYFKAGVYTQANSAGQGGDTEGTGAGEVTLYAIGASHP
jgi:Alginate lyase